jgi:diguanylate cyclase (GGDEF)-like protein/PAS domain S-box-containing protein
MLPIVMAALNETGLAPGRLVLQVSEDVIRGRDEGATANIIALRTQGVRVAIADFGVAYRSLSYVPETIFDQMKISGLVVEELDTATTHRAVLRASVGLCKSLGIVCCAVNVETLEQAEILLSEGCTLAQGSLFGPSLTAREVQGAITRMNPGAAHSAVTMEPPVKAMVSFFEVVEMANDVIIVTTAGLDDESPVIVYVNPAFTRLTGYSAAEAIGFTPRMLQGPGTNRKTLDTIRSSLAAGLSVHEKVLNYAKNGTPYWLDMRIVPMRDATGTVTQFAAIERDITMDRQRMDDLEFLVDRHQLTGIPNSRKLTRVVDAQISRLLANPGARDNPNVPCVGFIGIEGFAGLNDDLGRDVGNAILRGMAERLTDDVRRSDTLCHISGDVFAVCMPSLSHDEAEERIAGMCRTVSRTPFATPAGAVPIISNFGVADYNQGDTGSALIDRAETAMRYAKQASADPLGAA